MHIKVILLTFKRKIGTNALLFGIIAFIGVLLFWQSLIGNPHVAETFFGFAFSAGVGIFTYFRLRKWAKPTPP
jgi:uncharacterized membrane protein YedE/YeeE